MRLRLNRVAAVLVAACLFAGVLLDSTNRSALAQQAKTTIRERAVLESARSVEVRNQVPGAARVVSVVAEGTHVKKGDVLVKLSSTTIEEQFVERELELVQLRAKWSYAEEELKRVKLDGELQVGHAERALRLAISAKDRVLGTGGELSVAQAAAESEIAIAKARLETAQVLLKQAAGNVARSLELQLRITESQEALKVGEARKRFLDGPERKHKTAVLDLAIAETEADLERRKLHLKQSIASASMQLTVQRVAFDHAAQKLAQTKESLSHLQIVAPQDGTVVFPNTRNTRVGVLGIRAGSTVRERQTLLQVSDLSHFQLTFYVDESDAERLRVGQPATITVDALPNQTHSGKVVTINAPVEPSSRSRGEPGKQVVIVSLDDPPTQAKVGLTAMVEIECSGESN